MPEERVKRRCTESLEVKLTELDKVRAGSRLADLCSKKDAAVAAKQSAASYHTAAIKEIDEAIQKSTDVLIRGYERRVVDCEWRFHEPRDGYKTLYRLDSGEPVTVEEMTFQERQGSLFPEKQWPARLADGTWSFEGAAERRLDLEHDQYVALYALEVQPDVWLRGWRVYLDGKANVYPIGKGDEAIAVDRLAEDAPDAYGSEQEAFESAADDVLDAIDNYVLPHSPAVTRARLWAGAVLGGASEEEIVAEMRWPVAVDGLYPDDQAEVLMREFADGSSAKIRLLQVGLEEWVSGYTFGLAGGVDRDVALEAAYLQATRADAIKNAAKDALDEIANLASKLKGPKGKESLEPIRAWYEEQLQVAAQSEVNPWPQPNENGVYDDAQAEVLAPEKLPKGAEASIRVLQIGESVWIASNRYRCGEDGASSPLSRGYQGSKVHTSRGSAIREEAQRLLDDAETHLRGDRSKAVRTQALAIGKWAKEILAQCEEAEREAVKRVIEDQQVAREHVDNPGQAPLAERTAVEAVAALAQAHHQDGKAAAAGSDWQ